VFANPQPQVFVGKPYRQDSVFQAYPRRPDFLPVALTDLFELQRWVPWIRFQQRELLISPNPDLGRQLLIVMPEIRVRAVSHRSAPLKGPRISIFVISQNPADSRIDASGRKVGLELRVDRLRTMLIHPHIQLFQLTL
jgi:hypothetical protein